MRFFVNGALLVLVMAPGRSAPAAPSPSTNNEPYLTKEDIGSAAEATWSKIEDLTVDFTFNATKAPAMPDFFGARDHVIVTVKGSKTYVKREFGPAPQYGPIGGRETAYNGKQSTIHVMHMGRAWVGVERDAETTTQGLGFFDLTLLNPPKPPWDGINDQSLVSVVRSERSRVRPKLERVGGRLCHVIDVFGKAETQPQLTVWLDGERGCIPMRQVYFRRGNSNEAMEFVCEKAVENQGLWFAVVGRKRIFVGPGASATSPIEHRMEVKGWREGHPAISVNTGVPDAYFDLWKRLPMGTLVWDKEKDTSWTVGGTDFQSVGVAASSSFQDRPLTIPEFGAGARPTVVAATTERTSSWRSAAIACGIALVILASVGLYLSIRRRRDA